MTDKEVCEAIEGIFPQRNDEIEKIVNTRVRPFPYKGQYVAMTPNDIHGLGVHMRPIPYHPVTHCYLDYNHG